MGGAPLPSPTAHRGVGRESGLLPLQLRYDFGCGAGDAGGVSAKGATVAAGTAGTVGAGAGGAAVAGAVGETVPLIAAFWFLPNV